MTIRRYVRTACLLSVLTLTTIARADDAATAEAQARFKEGLDLVDASKFGEARLKFLQASAVLKAPAVLFNLAMTEQKTGYDVDAVEHYRAFLKTSTTDPRMTDAMRDKARQNIALLLPKVAQIDIEVAPGAKVIVDNKPLDEAPKEPIAVAAGRHTVEASFDGKTRSVNVDAAVGEITKAKIDFQTTEATSPQPPASEGERTTVGWVVPIGLGVLGVAGIVTGAVFSSASNSTSDDLAKQRQASPGLCAPPRSQACTGYEDKISTLDTQITMSWVGYGVGAAALIGAVATFVFLPKSSKTTTQARIVPTVHPRLAGATVQVSF